MSVRDTSKEVPASYISVWEARHELLGASYGTKNTKALERYHQEHPEMRDLEEWEVRELLPNNIY